MALVFTLAGQSGQQPAQIRVFIADDNYLIRQFFRSFILANSDLVLVGEAQNGEEALQGVRRTRPDVLLLDIRMPVLDGFEVYRRLQSEHYPGGVIFISGEFSQGDFQRLPELHAARYLSKTQDPKEVLAAIRTFGVGPLPQ